MRRVGPFAFVLVCGIAIGYVSHPNRPAPVAPPSADRLSFIYPPAPDGKIVRHALTVRRAVVAGAPPVDYEPARTAENGGVAIDPDEWVVVVDGRTYIMGPGR